MSRTHPPQKKSPTKQPTKQSKTSSTATEKKPEDNGELLQKILENQENLAKELQHIRDFHAAVEHAKEDDIRIFWEVRIIRGKDTPFNSTSGVSSLPALLSPKLVTNAPSMIQQEIVDKIALPLTAIFQKEGEDGEIEQLRLEDSDREPSFSPHDYGGKSGGGELIGLAAGEEVDEEEEDEPEEEADAKVDASKQEGVDKDA